MLFDEADSAPLKTWIATRLQDVSYADANVLTDYVLALLRYDLSEAEVRNVCTEQLEDFLREHTRAFVNDLFKVLSTKEYLPRRQPPPVRQPSFRDLFTSKPDQSNTNGQNVSRKRGLQERDGGDNDRDSGYGDRQFKQMRRGGKFGGPRGNYSGAISYSEGPADEAPKGMMFDPKSLPFDPKDPMAAMMAIQAMQAMGFPPPPELARMTGGGMQQPVRRINKRCRDYDIKGFCALGNDCPYEHGTDSVVLTNSDRPSGPPMDRGYVNGRGDRGGRGRGRGDRGRGDRGRGDRGYGDRGFGDRGRGRGNIFYKGQSSYSTMTPLRAKDNSTIVVENIPDEKLSEDNVYDYFGQFGDIREVSIVPHNNLAIIKFRDAYAAKAAHSSPKVIFDNRFVKVFWYKADDEEQQEQLYREPPVQEEMPDAPQFDMEEFKKKQEEAQQQYEERARKKRETEEALKELARRKEELLQKQAEEKRKLQERLGIPTDANGSSTPDAAPAPVSNGNGVTTTSEPQPQPANGKVTPQTEALRAQLAALEAEAKSLGIDSAASEESWSPRGRGRGAFRGGYRGSFRGGYAPRGSYRGAPSFRGRGGGPPRGRGGHSMRLDNRTKKVAVSGFTMDPAKDEVLRQHLLNFGDFESIEQNSERSDSQVVTFKERYMAELFFSGAKEIPQIGAVELAWVDTPAPAVNLATINGDTPATNGAASATAASTVANGNGADKGLGQVPTQQQPAQAVESNKHEDYDVADDEEGWMAE